MKSNKIKILSVILVVFMFIFAVMHLNSREEVPENALQISTGDQTYLVDISKLEYEQVTGTRVNGKGDENSKRSVSNVVQIMVEYSSTYTFTDDLGRTVSVENPQKVAALLGSYADMWFWQEGQYLHPRMMHGMISSFLWQMMP